MIEIRNINKTFSHKSVLNAIDLKIHSNTICGLIGKNGAGKSTLMNIITQVIPQDTGEIFINGEKFNHTKTLIKEKMGFVGQEDLLINELTGMQYLTFHGLIFNMNKKEIKEKALSLSDYFFDNPNDIFQFISHYSSGMRMKLRIMTAFLHNPQIILLDEPFVHLDPVASERLIVLLKKFVLKNNNIVFISSHDLFYISKLCTQICVLQDAHFAFDGDIDSFTKNKTSQFDESFLQIVNPEIKNTDNLNWLLL